MATRPDDWKRRIDELLGVDPEEPEGPTQEELRQRAKAAFDEDGDQFTRRLDERFGLRPKRPEGMLPLLSRAARLRTAQTGTRQAPAQPPPQPPTGVSRETLETGETPQQAGQRMGQEQAAGLAPSATPPDLGTLDARLRALSKAAPPETRLFGTRQQLPLGAELGKQGAFIAPGLGRQQPSLTTGEEFAAIGPRAVATGQQIVGSSISFADAMDRAINPYRTAPEQALSGWAKQIASDLKEKARKTQERYASSYTQQPFMDRLAQNPALAVSQAVGQNAAPLVGIMAGSAIPGVLLGPPVAAATAVVLGGLMEGGEAFESVLKETGDERLALMAGTQTAIINGALEAALPAKVVARLVPGAKTRLFNAALNAALEGGTEGTQEFFQRFAEWVYANRETKLLSPEAVDQYLEAIAGGMGGGLATGVFEAPRGERPDGAAQPPAPAEADRRGAPLEQFGEKIDSLVDQAMQSGQAERILQAYEERSQALSEELLYRTNPDVAPPAVFIDHRRSVDGIRAELEITDALIDRLRSRLGERQAKLAPDVQELMRERAELAREVANEADKPEPNQGLIDRLEDRITELDRQIQTQAERAPQLEDVVAQRDQPIPEAGARPPIPEARQPLEYPEAEAYSADPNAALELIRAEAPGVFDVLRAENRPVDIVNIENWLRRTDEIEAERRQVEQELEKVANRRRRQQLQGLIDHLKMQEEVAAELEQVRDRETRRRLLGALQGLARWEQSEGLSRRQLPAMTETGIEEPLGITAAAPSPFPEARAAQEYPELQPDQGDVRAALDSLEPQERDALDAVQPALGPPWNQDLLSIVSDAPGVVEDIDVIQQRSFEAGVPGVPGFKKIPPLPRRPYRYSRVNVDDPDDVAGRQWYHGTIMGLRDPNEFNYSMADPGALWFQGFYLTDNPNVAAGYANRRQEQVVGFDRPPGAVLRIRLPQETRLLDLEKPLPPDARAAIETVIQELMPKKLSELPFSTAPASRIINNLKAWWDLSIERGEGTWIDLPNAIQDALIEAGYDGFSHEGGALTGGEKHNVAILWGAPNQRPDFRRSPGMLRNLEVVEQPDGTFAVVNRWEADNPLSVHETRADAEQEIADLRLQAKQPPRSARGYDLRRGTAPIALGPVPEEPQAPSTPPPQEPPPGPPFPEEPPTEPSPEAPPEPAPPEEPPEPPPERPPPAAAALPPEDREEALEARGEPIDAVHEPGTDLFVGGGQEMVDTQGDIWEFSWAVVDAEDLVPSHDPKTFKPNEGYPQPLQRRQRGRVASQEQVRSIAQKPRPRDLLGSGERLGMGPPVVRPDGVVLDGNGRSMGLKLAYQKNNAKAYRSAVIKRARELDMPLDAVKRMKRPVLVRMTDLAPVDQLELARVANVGTGAKMAAGERALQDAERITEPIMDLYEPASGGDFTAASNRPFVRAVIGTIPEGDRPEMMTDEGELSTEGLRRIQAAVLAKAFPQPDLLNRMLETTDDNTRSVGRGLLASAPDTAKMQAEAEAGSIYPVDIGAEVSNAAAKLSEIRATPKMTVDKYLNQSRVFGEELTPIGRRLLELFDRFKHSSKKIEDLLLAYNRLARAEGRPDQATLLAAPEPDKLAILDRALNQMGEQPSLDLFREAEAEAPAAPVAEPEPAPQPTPKPEPEPEAPKPKKVKPKPKEEKAAAEEPYQFHGWMITPPAGLRGTGKWSATKENEKTLYADSRKEILQAVRDKKGNVITRERLQELHEKGALELWEEEGDAALDPKRMAERIGVTKKKGAELVEFVQQTLADREAGRSKVVEFPGKTEASKETVDQILEEAAEQAHPKGPRGLPFEWTPTREFAAKYPREKLDAMEPDLSYGADDIPVVGLEQRGPVVIVWSHENEAFYALENRDLRELNPPQTGPSLPPKPAEGDRRITMTGYLPPGAKGRVIRLAFSDDVTKEEVRSLLQRAGADVDNVRVKQLKGGSFSISVVRPGDLTQVNQDLMDYLGIDDAILSTEPETHFPVDLQTDLPGNIPVQPGTRQAPPPRRAEPIRVELTKRGMEILAENEYGAWEDAGAPDSVDDFFNSDAYQRDGMAYGVINALIQEADGNTLEIWHDDTVDTLLEAIAHDIDKMQSNLPGAGQQEVLEINAAVRSLEATDRRIREAAEEQGWKPDNAAAKMQGGGQLLDNKSTFEGAVSRKVRDILGDMHIPGRGLFNLGLEYGFPWGELRVQKVGDEAVLVFQGRDEGTVKATKPKMKEAVAEILREWYTRKLGPGPVRGGGAEKGFLNLGENELPGPEHYRYRRPELEARHKAGLRPPKPNALRKLAHSFLRWVSHWRQELRHIPRVAKDSSLQQVFVTTTHAFRRLHNYPAQAGDYVAGRLIGILNSLDEEQYDILMRKMTIDTARSIDRVNEQRSSYQTGLESPPIVLLPNGMTREELYDEVAQAVDLRVERDPRLLSAYEDIRSLWREARDEIVPALHALGLHGEARAYEVYGEEYMHHKYLQTEEEIRALERGKDTRPSERKRRELKYPLGRPWTRTRRGSEDRILRLDYATVQGTVITNMLIDAEIAQQLAAIRRDGDMKPELQRRAREKLNAAVDEQAKRFERHVRDTLFSRLPQLRLVDAYTRQEVREVEKKVRHVVRAYRRNLRRQLASEYTWQNEAKLAGLDKTHAEWSPRNNPLFFRTFQLASSVAQEVLDRGIAAVTRQDISRIKAVGAQETWYLPNEVVRQLNDHDRRTASFVQRSLRYPTSAWKGWTLLNPKGILRYLTRNFVGDNWRSFWANPIGYSQQFPRAFRELAHFLIRNEYASPEMRLFMEEGGFRGTFIRQEVLKAEQNLIRNLSGDIEATKQTFLEALSRPWSLLVSPLKWWMRKAESVQYFLETVGVFANFLDFLPAIRKTGRPPKRSGYAGSVRKEIDYLPTPQAQAYGLARDIAGRYDTISVNGQIMRDTLVPFWSFRETNARFYYRWAKNLAAESGLVDAIMERDLGKGWKTFRENYPYVALRLGQTAMLAVGLQAQLYFVNEVVKRALGIDDDELPEDLQNTSYILLGRGEDGRVRYFNRLSTFDEFIEMIPLVPNRNAWADYLDNRISFRELMAYGAEETFDYWVSSLTPFAKSPIELWLEVETWPKASSPRRMQDRMAFIADQFNLKEEYEALAGYYLPNEGEEGRLLAYVTDVAQNLAWYNVHPDRTAYYEIRAEVRRFQREVQGLNPPMGASPDPKKRAAISMREALWLRDFNAARKYALDFVIQHQKEIELGQIQGSQSPVESFEQTLRHLHPLHGVTREDQRERLMAWLGPRYQSKVTQALEYYQELLDAAVMLEIEGEYPEVGLWPKHRGKVKRPPA